MLNQHEASVIETLKNGEWQNQIQLRTSRQTLNKLTRLGILEYRLAKQLPYRVERNKQYRLKLTPARPVRRAFGDENETGNYYNRYRNSALYNGRDRDAN